MNIKKIKEKFLGKVVTVITTCPAINSSDRKFIDFFCGKLQDVDEDGLWVTHCITNCAGFYFHNQIVGILEEQVVYEDDANYKKIIEEVKKPPQSDGKINLESMIEIAQNSKPMLRKN